MLRRTILKTIGLAPVAAAVRGSVTTPIGQASQLSSNGPEVDRNWQFGATDLAYNKPDPMTEKTRQAMWAWIRGNQGYLDELREKINRETIVGHIDPDLMAMRSLSQAARIYYMRQRLVDRQMAVQMGDDPYTSMHDVHMRWIDLAKKALGFAL